MTPLPVGTAPGLRRLDAARLAAVLAGGAWLAFGYLTVALSGQVDPLRDPVSDYSLHAGGAAPFAAGVVLLLASGVALAVDVRRPHPAAVVFFTLWATGLLVVLLFRASTGVDPTTAGEIHRFGGAVVFASFPVWCWLAARALPAGPARRIRWLAVASTVAAAGFGVAQMVPAVPQGLCQRVALATHGLALLMLASALRKAVR